MSTKHIRISAITDARMIVVPSEKFFAAMLIDKLYCAYKQYSTCANSDLTEAPEQHLPELMLGRRPVALGRRGEQWVSSLTSHPSSRKSLNDPKGWWCVWSSSKPSAMMRSLYSSTRLRREPPEGMLNILYAASGDASGFERER